MCRTHRAEPQGCHAPAIYDRHKAKAQLASLLAEAQAPLEPPADTSWLAELNEWLDQYDYRIDVDRDLPK